MKRRIGTFIQEVRDRVRTQLAQRIVWLTHERCNQLGEQSLASALIGVIGREYYEERRKQYPVRGYWDLDRILRLELEGNSQTLSYIGPVKDDRREVVIFELNDRFDPSALNSLIWIPETFLVARALPPETFSTVERQGVAYFIADTGVSIIRGGTVRSPEHFAFAIGMPSDRVSFTWSAEDLRASFIAALRRLPMTAWLRFASPDINAWIRRHWRPAALAAVAALGIYLVSASAYLYGITYVRERELRALGPEVDALLEKQRAVDQLSKSQIAVVKLLQSQQPAYRLWGLAVDAIDAGGAVSGLFLQNGEMSIRGRAKVATDVLAKVATRKDVQNARFGSPVRPDGDEESFAITLKLSSDQPIQSTSKPVVPRGR